MGGAGRARRTWDGEPVSPTPPYGATVVVYRRAGGQPRFLLLHRRPRGPESGGDWAWGPPSGARYPGEAVDRCAERELLEETGLRLPLRRTEAGSAHWAVFLAEAPADAGVVLSAEHGRSAWLSLAEAAEVVAPRSVRAQVIEAARLLGVDG